MSVRDSAPTGPLVSGKPQEAGYGAVPLGITGDPAPSAMASGPYQAPAYTPRPGNTSVYDARSVQYQHLLGDSRLDRHAAEQNPSASAPLLGNNESTTFFTDEDIYLMSPHVKVKYEEVFKEADGADSFQLLGDAMGLVFKWTQLGVYRFFSVVFGILLVFIWGILFALINFTTVFVIQPVIKITFIVLRPAAMLFKAVVRSFLDPLWQSMGLMFSRVAGMFSFNLKGLPKAQETPTQAAIQEI